MRSEPAEKKGEQKREERGRGMTIYSVNKIQRSLKQ